MNDTAARRSSLGSSDSSGAVQRPADAEQMWHEGFDAGWRSGATRRTLRMDSAADSYGDGFDKEADYYGGVDVAGGGSPTCWSRSGDEGRAGWEDSEHAQRVGASALAMGPAGRAGAAAADAAWCQHSDAAAQEASARQQQFSGFSGCNQEGGYGTEGAQFVKFNKKASGALRPVQLLANGSWGDDLAVKLAAVSPFGASVHGSSGTAASSPKGGSPTASGSARVTPRSSPSAARKTGRRQAGIIGGGGGFSPLAGATNAMSIPFAAPFHTQDTAIKTFAGAPCRPAHSSL